MGGADPRHGCTAAPTAATRAAGAAFHRRRGLLDPPPGHRGALRVRPGAHGLRGLELGQVLREALGMISPLLIHTFTPMRPKVVRASVEAVVDVRAQRVRGTRPSE